MGFDTRGETNHHHHRHRDDDDRHTRDRYRHDRRSRSRSPQKRGHDDHDFQGHGRFRHGNFDKETPDTFWVHRREEREKIAERGLPAAWRESPEKPPDAVLLTVTDDLLAYHGVLTREKPPEAVLASASTSKDAQRFVSLIMDIKMVKFSFSRLFL